MKTIIQIPPQKPALLASCDQIIVLRSFQNFSCVNDDTVLLKRLGKKQASEIIKRLKTGEEIELKG